MHTGLIFLKFQTKKVQIYFSSVSPQYSTIRLWKCYTTVRFLRRKTWHSENVNYCISICSVLINSSTIFVAFLCISVSMILDKKFSSAEHRLKMMFRGNIRALLAPRRDITELWERSGFYWKTNLPFSQISRCTVLVEVSVEFYNTCSNRRWYPMFCLVPLKAYLISRKSHKLWNCTVFPTIEFDSFPKHLLNFLCQVLSQQFLKA